MEAAELIKRFREGKPMPREEREQQLKSKGKDRMWWESEEAPKLQARVDNPTVDTSSKLKISTIADPLEDVVRESRANRATSNSPSNRISRVRAGDMIDNDPIDFPRNELLRSYDPARDQNSPYRTRTLGRSLDVDSLIESELRQLQRDLQQKERDTVNRLGLGSFTPTGRVLDRGDTSRGPSRSPNRLRASRSGEFTFGRAGDRLAASGEVLRGSVDTLGSTGFLGLLKADLKLDGRKDEKKEETVLDSKLNVKDLNANLEELLKNLTKDAPQKSGYLPDGIEETIPQITAKLHQDMQQFTSLYESAIKQEEALAKDLKEREEKLRQEGRDQERANKLLQLEPPTLDPLSYLDLWMDPANPKGNKIINIPAGLLKKDDGNKQPDDKEKNNIKPHNSTKVMQRAIDNELFSAEETYMQMRQLRTQMGMRMRQLHAVQSSTSYIGNEKLDEEMKKRGILNGNFSMAPSDYRAHFPHGINPGDGSYWGLEDYEEEEKKNYGDIRKTFNPYPELVHENIFQVAKAVESSLNVAMDTLAKRLVRHESKESTTAASSTSASAPVPSGEKPAPPVVPHLALPSATQSQPAASADPEATKPAQPKPAESAPIANEKQPTQSSQGETKPTVLTSQELELSASFESAKSPFKNLSVPPPPYSKEQQKKDLESIDAVLGKGTEVDKNPKYLSTDPLRHIRQPQVVFAPQNDKIREYNRQFNQHTPAAPAYAPSAPPAAFDYSFAVPPTQVQPPINQYATNNPYLTQNFPNSNYMSQTQPIYYTNQNVPRRPLEGMAINYLKSHMKEDRRVYNQIQPTYNAPPQMNAFVPGPGINSPPQKAPNAISLPSQDASMKERESYLKKMKSLRENIASAVHV